MIDGCLLDLKFAPRIGGTEKVERVRVFESCLARSESTGAW